MRVLGRLLVAITCLGAVPMPICAAPWSAMSPAGKAAYKAAVDQSVADLMVVVRRQSETRSRIDQALLAEHPDWADLRALMDQDFADEERMRRMSRATDLRLLDTLPEADRLLFLRDRYPSSAPPPLIIVPKR